MAETKILLAVAETPGKPCVLLQESASGLWRVMVFDAVGLLRVDDLFQVRPQAASTYKAFNTGGVARRYMMGCLKRLPSKIALLCWSGTDVVRTRYVEYSRLNRAIWVDDIMLAKGVFDEHKGVAEVLSDAREVSHTRINSVPEEPIHETVRSIFDADDETDSDETASSEKKGPSRPKTLSDFLEKHR